MDYDSFRHFADSWFLGFLVLFFLGAVLWTLRPGSTDRYQAVALLPLDDDENRDDR